MRFEGSLVVGAPVDKVWGLISNPVSVSSCLPEVQKLEVKDSRNVTVTLKLGFAFLKGNFTFDFSLLDEAPPSYARIRGIGRGTGGTIELTASIDLKSLGAGASEMAWACEATFGGLLREVPESLIRGVADKLAKQLFNCIEEKLMG